MQADLVPVECQNEDMVTVKCVHGDQFEYATANVYIKAGDQTFLLRVGLVSQLPYSVLFCVIWYRRQPSVVLSLVPREKGWAI